MTRTFKTYCPFCDDEVNASLKNIQETLTIRNEDITYTATVAQCPECGELIGDSRLESKNLDTAYARYRQIHNIMSPGEIKALRAGYGLSLREFGRFLGFGEQTIPRYESGSIPDDSHNAILHMAEQAEGAQKLLELNKGKLSAKSIEKIKKHILVINTNQTSNSVCDYSPLENSLSRYNGYRTFDLNRIASLVLALSSRCKMLYKTKLQKALYYCDALNFERTSKSMTGAIYAHADFGPVMDNWDEILVNLKQTGVIDIREHGWGELIIPKAEVVNNFNKEEHDLIDEVANYVNSFTKASDLVDASHKLSVWMNTKSGEHLDYTQINDEVSTAIKARICG